MYKFQHSEISPKPLTCISVRSDQYRIACFGSKNKKNKKKVPKILHYESEFGPIFAQTKTKT